jgi:hypothetical protein
MKTDILDAYVKNAPSSQNVIDIFKGEWSSKMPSHSNLTSIPGPAALFEDGRILWVDGKIGGFWGKDILELGPLEGAHSYMMQKLGARSIVAIEANTRAYMKCLCVKEVFHLDKVQFRLGDFVSYFDQNSDRFDAVIASGILYHQADPISLLAKIATTSDSLFVWTHYYDREIIEGSLQWKPYFDFPQLIEVGVFQGLGARRNYNDALNWQGFAGGSSQSALWLSKPTILAILKDVGFDRVEVTLDHPDHPHGPAFAFLAQRERI